MEAQVSVASASSHKWSPPSDASQLIKSVHAMLHPRNIALVGALGQLRAAFAALDWTEADRLNLVSSWRMVRAFVLNAPYPTAPFSTLFLFGRGQDIGFQKAIDDSPRKRHHVWADVRRFAP